jgi:malate dehydrogenase (oxaloacetate-decarboxylating)
MLVAAAEAIANRVADDELNASYIIPSVFDPHVAADVAAAVAAAAHAAAGTGIPAATAEDSTEAAASADPAFANA